MNPHGATPPDEAERIAASLPHPRRRVWVRPVEAAGRVCAEPLFLKGDLPPFDRSTMDGFAVASGQADRIYPLAGASHAGGFLPDALAIDQAMPISTGAPVPPGTYAVVPIERTTITETGVSFSASPKEGANVVRKGSEGRTGDLLIEEGALWGAGVIAAAIAGGHRLLPIWAAPSLGILVTGDEVGSDASSGIPDSNGPLILAMLASLGLTARVRHGSDDATRLETALRDLSDCEVVITTGGVSMGPKDLVPPLLRAIGAEIVLHGVAQKPGKPMLLATLGARRFFALPGNPLAVHLCMHRYVLPHLKDCLGIPNAPRWIRGLLAADVGASMDRTEFVPLRIRRSASELPSLHPTPANSSGHLMSLAHANALWRRAPHDPPRRAGEIIVAEELDLPSRGPS